MFVKTAHLRKIVAFISLFSAIVYLGFIIRDMDPESRLIKVISTFERLLSKPRVNKSEICSFIQLDPFDPVVLPYTKKYPTLSCKIGKQPLVYLENAVLKVNRTKVSEKFPHSKFVGCKYKNLRMKEGTDHAAEPEKESKMFKDEIHLLPEDENLLIECYDSNNRVLAKSYKYVMQLKKKVEARCEWIYRRHQQQFRPKETLSVLLLGTEATSKQNFERAMPKTRAFFLEKMQAMEFHKFNKVGSHTLPNVGALLTGRNLPTDFKKEWKKSHPFDEINYAFVWNDFRQAGYRTSVMIGDSRVVTAFHYGHAGWHKQYVDYNSRPMVVTSDLDKEVRSNEGRCVGNQSEIEFLTDQTIQLVKLFNANKTKPYFGYSFMNRLFHNDLNQASRADDIYLDILTRLHDSQALNNTMIVFFSDHGNRFGSIMNTLNGMMESNMPFLFLMFPPWFYKKYPEVHKTLKVNQHRLATFYDVHFTLLDLIYFKGETGQGDVSHRAISLFKEIPDYRTCNQAGIPDEYCVCLDLVKSPNISATSTHFLAETLLEKVRSSGNATMCEKLYLDQVVNVLELKNKQKDDKKGKEFLLSIKTKPGGALYKGTLSMSKDRKARVIGTVERMNMYKGQAECIDDKDKRAFCYCKNTKIKSKK